MSKNELDELSELLNSIKHCTDLKISLAQGRDCPVSPSFYLNKCYLKINNTNVVGTGESFSLKESQLKALGECLERWPIVDSSLKWNILSITKNSQKINLNSSNGCAFHTNLDVAVLSAKRELVERHVILNSWLNKDFVREVKFPIFTRLQNFINEKITKTKMKVFYFENEFELPVFCTQLSGDDFCFFGYGADLIKEKAVIKSYFEAWRFFWDFQSNLKREYSEDEDECLKHYYYWLNNNDEQAFNSNCKIKYNKIKSLKKLEYEGCDIFYCDLSQKGIHGFVAKVEDSNLTELWTGPLTKDLLNRKKGDFHPIA